MITKNPKILPPPNPKNRILDFVGWLIALLHLAVVGHYYTELPDIIPTHYNLKGEVDGYGSKTMLWFLPILGLALYIGLYTLIKKIKPWNHNYPLKVTETNAEQLYAMSTSMLYWINVSVALLFFVISITIILKATSNGKNSFNWLLPTLIAIVTLLPFLFIYKMRKHSKN